MPVSFGHHRRGLQHHGDVRYRGWVCRYTTDGTLADTIAAPETSPDSLDEDWRNAVLKSATEHVLTKTALSDRDREIYRFYVQEGHSIDETSEKFHQSRNNISQIKTRIEKRIAAIGREMAAAAERI